jgi:hypothetical protein
MSDERGQETIFQFVDIKENEEKEAFQFVQKTWVVWMTEEMVSRTLKVAIEGVLKCFQIVKRERWLYEIRNVRACS